MKEGGKTQAPLYRLLFVSSLICIFNLSFILFKIYLFVYISDYCLFVCYDCLFNFVRFGIDLCLNSQIFLFILSFTCKFNLSFPSSEIYLFIYTSTCCKAICYDYLFSFYSFRAHLVFNSNFWLTVSGSSG